MRIEDQIVTLPQAKRLKELGIAQKAYFSFIDAPNIPFCKEVDLIICPTFAVKSNIMTVNKNQFEQKMKRTYSAYTVAELWQMMPTLGISVNKSNNGNGTDFYWVDCHYIKSKFDNISAVEVMADMLIDLLERKTVTAQECNERLTK